MHPVESLISFLYIIIYFNPPIILFISIVLLLNSYINNSCCSNNICFLYLSILISDSTEIISSFIFSYVNLFDFLSSAKEFNLLEESLRIIIFSSKLVNSYVKNFYILKIQLIKIITLLLFLFLFQKFELFLNHKIKNNLIPNL